MKAKNKIFSRRGLTAWVEKQRQEGKKIVFTNGCFDILHAGHVSVLEFSRAKGDVLVVGINSDDSVRRLKGPTRPVNKQADRALVLAALQSVDAVRGSRNKAIDNSICGYNHMPVTKEESGAKLLNNATIDKETGLYFKNLSNGVILNLYNLCELEESFSVFENDEYISIGNHEQYFYPDYFSYQPEYADKLLKAAEIMHRCGREFIFAEELAK